MRLGSLYCRRFMLDRVLPSRGLGALDLETCVCVLSRIPSFLRRLAGGGRLRDSLGCLIAGG
jgi:hypothetical protein